MRVDVEALLVAYLNANGVPCWADAPAEPPSRFATVDRTGGSHSEYVDVATVSVDCVAESRYEASVLARSVDALLPGFVSEPGIRRVERDSITNLSHIVDGREGLYRIVASVWSFDAAGL